jgi:LacI family transcriptional regulator
MELETITQRVTLRDVAAAANVSIATASRALSGKGGSSATTIATVLAASERLEYRPDPVARSLRAQSTGLIGMIVPGIANPFFAELVEAIELELQKGGAELLLSDSQGNPKREIGRIQTLLDRRVDGLIIVPTGLVPAADLRKVLGNFAAVVQLDRQIDGLARDFVGVDNGQGIRLILDHLVATGARRITFVSGESESSTGRSRTDAYRSVISRMEELETIAEIVGSFSVEFGRDAGVQIASARALPDAVVCASDVIAIGVVRALHDAGIAIPDDVRVTGFDGILFSELCDPPLTTVVQPFAGIAREARRLLDERMGGATFAAQRSSIAPELTIRRSTSR